MKNYLSFPPENDETKDVADLIPSGLQPENAKDLSLISTILPSKVHHNTIIQPGEESEFTPRPPTKDNYLNPPTKYSSKK